MKKDKKNTTNFNYLSLDEIKQIELNILIEFAKFCDQNNLKYYLAYGTLLGAIRHKGFIPWDDDIDVVMPRPDYEEFVKLTGFNPIKKNLETRLYRDCANVNIYPFAKVIDTNTIVFEKGKTKKNISGLWIDIFPLDGFQNNSDASLKQFNKYLQLRNLQDLATTNPFYVNQSKIKKIIKFLFISPIIKLYGIRKICEKIEKNALLVDYEKSELVFDFTWGDTINAYIDKSEMEPSAEVEFEKNIFKTFKDWNSYLSRLYGNYMQLPPEKDRIPHGFNAYIKNYI